MRLTKIKLNENEYPLSNVVVIIGPNNSGKTRFLSDLYHELTNSYERTQNNDYVSSQSDSNLWPRLIDKNYFEFSPGEVTYWLDNHVHWLNSDGRRRQSQNGPNRGQELLRSNMHPLQYTSGESTALTQAEIDNIRSNQKSLSEWLVKFKKSHIGYEDIDNRFNTANLLDSIDVNNQDNANILYARPKIVNGINKHISALFGKTLVSLKLSRTNHGFILVDDTDKKRPKWARSNSFDADQKTITEHVTYKEDHISATIARQSHGTRAAISIMMTLADPSRSIVFFDEPESHIYPAARKYLAREIAKLSKNRQFFVVTHDVDFLEGIANSRRDFTVIKINQKHKVKVIDFNSVERRRTSSELKNSKALRAGFYDAAIFVEGIQDRYVYEYIIRRKQLVPDGVEYGVIDCGGNDRIADSVKFALDIGTSVAIVTDFDTLIKPKKKNGVEVNPASRIIYQMSSDESIVVLLGEVENIMKGRSNAKKGLSADNLSTSEVSKINELLNKLKTIGIFVVPNGELYDWFGVKSKAGIAVEDLRNRYDNNSKKYNELTKFLTELSQYIIK